MSRSKKAGRQPSKAKRFTVKTLTKWLIVAVAVIFMVSVVSLWISPAPKQTKPIGDVVVIDQFYSQNPEFTDRTMELLKSQGLAFKTFKDNEVTVELYRKLPTLGSRLIILRVHSGVSLTLSNNPTFLYTTEPYTTSEYVYEQLTDQIWSGVIVEGVEENPVFTIGPLFVTKSMEGTFDGATIILSSCHGLRNNYLAEAFVEKGAAAFISWTEKVDLEHTDRAVLRLLEALIKEKRTIKDAVNQVMKEVGPDPVYKSVLAYYPLGTGANMVYVIDVVSKTTLGSGGRLQRCFTSFKFSNERHAGSLETDIEASLW